MQLIIMLLLVIGTVKARTYCSCSDYCPETEEVVWALDTFCEVFRNKCYFDKENRLRDPILMPVSKEECQKKCPRACTKELNPVTAIYFGQTKTFANPCLMRVYVCQTGETYLPVKNA